MAANILPRSFRKRVAKQRTLAELAAMKQQAALREEQELAAKLGNVNSIMGLGAKAYGLADKIAPLFGSKGDSSMEREVTADIDEATADANASLSKNNIPSTGGLESVAQSFPAEATAAAAPAAPAAGTPGYDRVDQAMAEAEEKLAALKEAQRFHGESMSTDLLYPGGGLPVPASSVSRGIAGNVLGQRGAGVPHRGGLGGDIMQSAAGARGLQMAFPRGGGGPPQQIEPQQAAAAAAAAPAPEPQGRSGEIDNEFLAGLANGEMRRLALAEDEKYGTKAEYLAAIKDAAERGDRDRVFRLQQSVQKSQLRDVAPTSLQDMIMGTHLDRARSDITKAGEIDPLFESKRDLNTAHEAGYWAKAESDTETANRTRTLLPGQRRKGVAEAGMAETTEKYLDEKLHTANRHARIDADYAERGHRSRIRKEGAQAYRDIQSGHDMRLTRPADIDALNRKNFEEAKIAAEASGWQMPPVIELPNGKYVKVSPEMALDHFVRTGRLPGLREATRGTEKLPGATPGSSIRGAAARARKRAHDETEAGKNSRAASRAAEAVRRAREKAQNKEADLGAERAKVMSRLRAIADKYPVPANNEPRRKAQRDEMMIHVKAAIADLDRKGETPENISKIIKTATGQDVKVSRNANQDIVFEPGGK